MRSNEIGKKIQTKSPPYCSKDVTCHLLHFPHDIYTMIHLGEKLQYEYEQQYRHDNFNLLFSD